MEWRIPRAAGFAVFVLLVFAVNIAGADVSASAGKSWSRLQAGQDVLWSIGQDDIPFTIIKFTLKNMTENVYIDLDVLTDNDTLIETPAPETVYKYIRAISTNIQTRNLEKASIQFRVNNTWISGNNIKNDTIALYQYETSWSKLDTIFLREEEDYAYYLAPVENFLLFAVSGEKVPATLLCSPGGKKCVTNDLYQCSSDGTGWEFFENCTYGCDSVANSCREEPSCPECPEPETGVCNPGEQKCSGNDLQQCNSEGSGWDMVKTCPGGCILCAGEELKTDTNLLYMAVIICQVVIGILIVVVIALAAYLRLHK